MSIYSFMAILSAEQNIHPSVSSFSFSSCQQQPAVLIRSSNEPPGHIPEQGNGLYLNMLQCTTQELPNLLKAEVEYTWSSHSLQEQRVYNVPAAHPRKPVQVSSLLTHIHDRTGENGTQGMDRRDHDHHVQPAQCKKKHLSFSFYFSPYSDHILLKCHFSSSKTYPFSACHISMLTV